MRLFVAVRPPAPAIDDLATAVAAVRGASTRGWVDQSRWHVTLAFLGEVPDEVVPRLADALADIVATAEPMTLRCAGAGTFGSPRAGGVLWLGLGGDTEPLARLAARVGRAARSSGIGVDARPFRAHLTLARGRQGEDLRPAATALRDYRGPDWQVTHVHLVRSVLGPQAVHTDVGTFPVAR